MNKNKSDWLTIAFVYICVFVGIVGMFLGIHLRNILGCVP